MKATKDTIKIDGSVFLYTTNIKAKMLIPPTNTIDKVVRINAAINHDLNCIPMLRVKVQIYGSFSSKPASSKATPDVGNMLKA